MLNKVPLTGTSYGSGTYTFKTSSYADTNQDMSLIFDHLAVIAFQPTHFAGGHYSTSTGDFVLNGDSRFTLDGSYYGQFLMKLH